MARAPRIDFPDAVYHVTSRGNGRAEILFSDDDRQRFLGQLSRHVQMAGVVLYAYVLVKLVVADEKLPAVGLDAGTGGVRAPALDLAGRVAAAGRAEFPPESSRWAGDERRSG